MIEIFKKIYYALNPAQKKYEECENRIKEEYEFYRSFGSNLIYNPTDKQRHYPMVRVMTQSIDRAIESAKAYHKETGKETIICCVVGYEVREYSLKLEEDLRNKL